MLQALPENREPMDALIFVVETLFDLYILTFILRVVLQYARTDFYNPFSQFIVRVTNPLVVPLRRVIPPWGRVDLATVAAVLLLEITAVLAIAQLVGAGVPGVLTVLEAALMRTVLAVIRLYFFAILVFVIMSWVAPGTYHPVSAVLAAVCEPVLRPVRKLIPPIGGLDLSPLFVLIGLQALMMLLRGI